MDDTPIINESLIEEQEPSVFQRFFCCFTKNTHKDQKITKNIIHNMNTDDKQNSNDDDDDDALPTWCTYTGSFDSDKSHDGRTVRFHSCCDE
jgi:hypothetical protein